MQPPQQPSVLGQLLRKSKSLLAQDRCVSFRRKSLLTLFCPVCIFSAPAHASCMGPVILNTAMCTDHSAAWRNWETSKWSCHATRWRHSESRQGLLAKFNVTSICAIANAADSSPCTDRFECRSHVWSGIAASVMSSCLRMMQVVYSTACCGEEAASDGSFTPLTINYNERFSAAGRTRCVEDASTVMLHRRHRGSDGQA